MRIPPRARGLLRLLPLVALGALLVAYRDLMARSLHEMRHIHPVVLANLPLFLVWNYLAARGWRSLLVATSKDAHALPAWRLSLIRIEGQAVNLSVPLTGLGGEALRATLAARGRERLPASVSATILDNVAITAAGLVFAASAIAVRVLSSSQPSESLGHWLTALPVALGLTAAVVVMPFVMARALRRRAREGGVIARLSQPFEHSRRVKAALGRAFGWHLLERSLCAGEIYVILAALGQEPRVLDAAFVSAVLIVISFTLFFIPGQIGAADAGIVGACAAVGLPVTIAISIALLRRLRQLVFCASGLLMLSLAEGRNLRDARETPVATTTAGGQEEPI